MSQSKKRSNLSKSFNLLSNHNSAVQARFRTAEDGLGDNKTLSWVLGNLPRHCSSMTLFLFLFFLLKDHQCTFDHFHWSANTLWKSKGRYDPRCSLGLLNKYEISSLVNILPTWWLRYMSWSIRPYWQLQIFFFNSLFNFFFIFCLYKATAAAYGGSQARGLIGAVADSLHQSHSNARSELRLWPTPQLMATPDP